METEMAGHSQFDAGDSYLGYVYQGLYALMVLLEAHDDAASVCIESGDDVRLTTTANVALHQLKHSLDSPSALSIKNDGFWKAIRNWSARVNDPSVQFYFVTSARVVENDRLEVLADPKGDRSKLVDALLNEAQRVHNSRVEAASKNIKLPYGERAEGCEAFINLSLPARVELTRRITLHPRIGSIVDIPDRVIERLRNFIRQEHRRQVAERLIEWWDRQVALALLGKRAREMHKGELVSRLQELAAEHLESTLPNDFSMRKPGKLEEERGGNWERQITLVNGGDSRIGRALVAKWRAREQRNRWMLHDVSLATLLKEYDDRLEEYWGDRHGPMCNDCAGGSEELACTEGLKLLDWSHLNAPNEVPPVRPEWREPFYVQGSYQQLADELRVGWHPDYERRLKAGMSSGSTQQDHGQDGISGDVQSSAVPVVDAATKTEEVEQ
ncbi:ABC-three component system protein [Archangium gephyra]|uniref:ABC-three component system protein n=1 Tax=Archangium gephyra TaxID=48 RepID=UPI003B82060F